MLHSSHWSAHSQISVENSPAALVDFHLRDGTVCQVRKRWTRENLPKVIDWEPFSSGFHSESIKGNNVYSEPHLGKSIDQTFDIRFLICAPSAMVRATGFILVAAILSLKTEVRTVIGASVPGVREAAKVSGAKANPPDPISSPAMSTSFHAK